MFQQNITPPPPSLKKTTKQTPPPKKKQTKKTQPNKSAMLCSPLWNCVPQVLAWQYLLSLHKVWIILCNAKKPIQWFLQQISRSSSIKKISTVCDAPNIFFCNEHNTCNSRINSSTRNHVYCCTIFTPPRRQASSDLTGLKECEKKRSGKKKACTKEKYKWKAGVDRNDSPS